VIFSRSESERARGNKRERESITLYLDKKHNRRKIKQNGEEKPCPREWCGVL